MDLKCVPGEKLVALAMLFATQFSCGLDGNEILAWGDFFSVAASALIAIADRKLYIEDPSSSCQTTTSPSPPTSTTPPKKCSR